MTGEEEQIFGEIKTLLTEPPKPAPIRLPVAPIAVSTQGNRDTCARCERRQKKHCGVDGVLCVTHADGGNCPLGKFGTTSAATTAAPMVRSPAPHSPLPFFIDQHRPLHLNGLYRGRSAFLICGGPSFASLDSRKLRQPGIVTMGLNNSPKSFRPNLWIHGDSADRFIRSIWTDPTITKFTPLHLRDSRVFDSDGWKWTDLRSKECPSVFFYKLGTGFRPHAFLSGEHVVWGNNGKEGGVRTTFLAAIRVLFELGFRRVFLLGADFQMDPKAGYHFEQARSQSSANGNNHIYRVTNERCKQLVPYFQAARFEVFNCNPDSKLTAFPFIPYEKAIDLALGEFGRIDVVKERTAGLYDAVKPSQNKNKLWGKPLPADHPKVFSHGCHAGDLLYALPTIRALGGGKLRIVTGRGITPQIAQSLVSLVRLQPYITDVDVSDRIEGVDMTRWKERFWELRGRLNIADQTLGSFGLPFDSSKQQWLWVPDPLKVHRVIFHRSPRYRNPAFPWKRVWEKYRDVAGMVGSPSEHEEFCRTIGPVPYVKTKDYLELARVIAGAELFVGNQSSPYAVAEGMKIRTVQETSPRIPNCHWERPGATYGRDASVILPELGA